MSVARWARMGRSEDAGVLTLYVEWGSTNTAGTSMFKISHIHKV